MPKPDVLAFDKSVRSKGVDGHLYVESSPISKACVSPYMGSEIPDFQMLGLSPDKIYYLLRDPVELAKAADSFRGLPILITHMPTSASNHPKEITIGAVGTDVVFTHPYLEAPLCIWTEEAIAGIETKVQTEISSGYRYTADMTPGQYEGQQYDGVMRNITGNHIALVDVGRAGPDVVVQDKLPETLRTTKMPLSRAAVAVSGALRAYLTPKLAQDAAIGSLGKLLADVKDAAFDKTKLVAAVNAHMVGKLAVDAKTDDMKAALDALDPEDMAKDEEEDDEEAKKKAKEGAKDEFPDAKEKKDDDKDKPAMDSAKVSAMIAEAVAGANVASAALYAARTLVRPICGEVACDSAEAVHAFALKHLGIDTTGVHASAFPAMIKMAQDRKPATVIAQDSASVSKTAALIPGLARLIK